MTIWDRVRSPFWELLFPPRCLACETPLSSGRLPLFCPDCLAGIRFLQPPCCGCCGRPFFQAAGGDHLCGTCLTTSRNFSRARAALLYQEPVAKAIQAFKYQHQWSTLASFAALGRQALLTAGLRRPDLILPVPLHPRRLRQRGFNQALVLAKRLFPQAGKRIHPSLLIRQRWTEPQAGLSGPARRRNLYQAFAVQKPARVSGCSILLVDDVYTTGSTVDACAGVLRRAGAAEVQVFTLARVRKERG